MTGELFGQQHCAQPGSAARIEDERLLNLGDKIHHPLKRGQRMAGRLFLKGVLSVPAQRFHQVIVYSLLICRNRSAVRGGCHKHHIGFSCNIQVLFCYLFGSFSSLCSTDCLQTGLGAERRVLQGMLLLTENRRADRPVMKPARITRACFGIEFTCI